jgi:hypothetical protein
VSPDIIDPFTNLGIPTPVILRLTFGADSRASIKPVEVMLSMSIKILVFETVINGFFHFDTNTLFVRLVSLVAFKTLSIGICALAFVRIGNALVFAIEVVCVLAFDTDFLASQKPRFLFLVYDFVHVFVLDTVVSILS